MDYRKKESPVEPRRSGWTVKAVPATVHQPGMPTPTPAPNPLPEPIPMPTPPAQECGYCITPGMAYVPMTEFSDVYEAEEGFGRGTIFAELDLPFMGKGDCRRG